MKKKFKVQIRREKHIPFCMYVSNNYGDHHTSVNFHRREDVEETIKALQRILKMDKKEKT